MAKKATKSVKKATEPDLGQGNMIIEKVIIKHFKCFTDFTFALNNGINIIVGNNEAGKSTILEAIHLSLTGIINGRYLKNELSQHLFNNMTVKTYLDSINSSSPLHPPEISLEVFFKGNDDLAILEGNGNSLREKASGVSLKILFDENFRPEYEELLKTPEKATSIPIEYYKIDWQSFARSSITARSIPFKSALIDSASNRFQNGSDIYISRIVRELLEPNDIVAITQARRHLGDMFQKDDAIKRINLKIKNETSTVSSKNVELQVDTSQNEWDGTLLTYLDDVPFHQIGKGEQCIIKTNLALSHKKAREANVILLEEPENHLAHSKLNNLLRNINDKCNDKQIIISTHSSFVANKLGLRHLVFLHNQKTVPFDELDEATQSFFDKLPGYDTLRMILSKKVILVEGPSDELVVQKAYRQNHNGRLPIEDGIDVISVGTSFLRFIEIAGKIQIPLSVVTDNDGDINALKNKYSRYLDSEYKGSIKICFDPNVDNGTDNDFNYNTLEPKIAQINGLEKMNQILGKAHKSLEELHKYMKRKKTECALCIFDTTEQIAFPQYILDAIAE